MRVIHSPICHDFRDMGVNLDLVLAIIPKIGSALSIPSSMFIISESLSDHQRGKGTAIQRTLVGMSVVDVAASFAWFLSTWAVPKGTAPLSRGNLTSCNFQGFLLQLAVGVSLFRNESSRKIDQNLERLTHLFV